MSDSFAPTWDNEVTLPPAPNKETDWVKWRHYVPEALGLLLYRKGDELMVREHEGRLCVFIPMDEVQGGYLPIPMHGIEPNGEVTAFWAYYELERKGDLIGQVLFGAKLAGSFGWKGLRKERLPEYRAHPLWDDECENLLTK